MIEGLKEEKGNSQIQEKIFRSFNKACTQYSLLEDGDRILLALSGGKDSLYMTQLMAQRARIHKPSFKVEAAHVVMKNIPYQTDLEYLHNFCSRLSIPLHVIETSFDAHSDSRKTPCFLCARYRRRALFSFATAHGFNKVALGHHQDDFLATMLMNLLYEGMFGAMAPAMKLEHFDLTLIRPLCLTSSAWIAQQAQEEKMVRQLAPCPYEQVTKRDEMERLLLQLNQLHPEARNSMWHALERQWSETRKE